jgi:hypothetical protein
MWKLLRNLALAAIFIAGALKLLAGYAVGQDAQRVMALLAPYAQVKYDGLSAGLDGDVTISGVSVAPKDAHRVYRADTVVLDTPGLFWLLKHALLHENALPPHFAIDVDGLMLPPEPWLNPHWWDATNFVPFAAAGCETGLGSADFRHMGIDAKPTHERLQYTYAPDQHSLDATLTLTAPGFATVALEAQLSHFDPSGFAAVGFWDKMHSDQLSATYTDHGFFALRNRYCAERAKLTSAQFVDRHLAAVQALLQQRGIQPADELLRLYRKLVSGGGQASVLSLPGRGFANGAWRTASRDELLRQLNVTARYQDKPPIMFRLAFMPAPEPIVMPPARQPDSTPAVGASVAFTPLPPPASAPPPPAPSTPKAVVVTPSAPAVVTPPVQSEAVKPAPAKVPAVDLNYLDRAEAEFARKLAPAPVAPAAETHAAPLAPAGVSAASPPPNSTLALIWKPGVVEQLPEAAPVKRDYDVIAFAQLAELPGRHVRVVTLGGKTIEGYVVSADGSVVLLRVNRGGGDAQFALSKDRIGQVQLLHW